MAGDDVPTEDKLESGDILGFAHESSSLSCGRQNKGDGWW